MIADSGWPGWCRGRYRSHHQSNRRRDGTHPTNLLTILISLPLLMTGLCLRLPAALGWELANAEEKQAENRVAFQCTYIQTKNSSVSIGRILTFSPTEVFLGLCLAQWYPSHSTARPSVVAVQRHCHIFAHQMDAFSPVRRRIDYNSSHRQSWMSGSGCRPLYH